MFIFNKNKNKKEESLTTLWIDKYGIDICKLIDPQLKKITRDILQNGFIKVSDYSVAKEEILIAITYICHRLLHEGITCTRYEDRVELSPYHREVLKKLQKIDEQIKQIKLAVNKLNDTLDDNLRGDKS